MISKEIPILSKETLHLSDLSLMRNPIVTYPTHGHECYEILIYEPFDGEISVNGSVFPTEVPTAILITPKDFHSTTLRESGDARCYKLQLSHEAFEKCFPPIFSPTVTQNPERVEFLRALAAGALMNRESREILLRCAELIVLTLRESTGTLPYQSRSTSLVHKATEIVNRRFREPLTLSSVASELYVSPQYLSASFSRYTGMGFSQYLINRRLAYAAGMLENGETATEACFGSGFRNLSHFLRTFKRVYGETPASFGRGHRERGE